MSQKSKRRWRARQKPPILDLIWVDPDKGDDRQEGRDPDRPCRTLGRALTVAENFEDVEAIYMVNT